MIDPIDRDLLYFLCAAQHNHCRVRMIKAPRKAALKRLRESGYVASDSYEPTEMVMARWRRAFVSVSPPSPGGAAGEEQPTPKAADAEGGAAARTVAAPPIAETFPKCGHPKTLENTRIVGRHKSAACDVCWRESLRAGQQRRQARKQQAVVRPFEVEPAHYEPADRQQRTAHRKIAAGRQQNTRRAQARIEQGLDPRTCKQASVRHAQFALEEENRQRDMLADPIEVAKAKLQRRYKPVICMGTVGGDPSLYMVGNKRNVTKDELLEMAGRLAA